MSQLPKDKELNIIPSSTTEPLVKTKQSVAPKENSKGRSVWSVPPVVQKEDSLVETGYEMPLVG